MPKTRSLDLLTEEHTPYLPKVIAFDLDYTLWPLWIDTHTEGPPFIYDPLDNSVLDIGKQRISLFPGTLPVLELILKSLPDTILAIASRTGASAWAESVLRLIRLPTTDKTLWDTFTIKEIYRGSKLRHIQTIAHKAGCSTNDILFFDDELRNSETERLGVMFVHINDDIGIEIDTCEHAIWRFIEREKTKEGKAEGMQDQI